MKLCLENIFLTGELEWEFRLSQSSHSKSCKLVGLTCQCQCQNWEPEWEWEWDLEPAGFTA
jgi:hypothetical protein